MFPVAGVAGLGLGLVQSFLSSQQQRKQDAAFQQALAARPAYQIPQATKDALAQSQAQLNETNPAIIAAQNQLRQQAANQMGFAQNNASSGTSALAAAANANQAYNSAVPQLAQAQTQYHQQNEQNYQQSLAQMARAQENVTADQQEANQALQNYHLGRVGAANSGLGQGLGLLGQGLGILGQADMGNPFAKKVSSTPMAQIGLNPLSSTAPSYTPPTTLSPISAPVGPLASPNAYTAPFQPLIPGWKQQLYPWWNGGTP